MKNIITEMKNTLKSISSRLNNTEEWIWSWKTVVEISYAEEKTMNRNEDILRDFWDVKLIFICILGSPQNREKEAKNIIEDIIAENFHVLEKNKQNPKLVKGKKS